jgi:PAS domain S-box-containing protein
MAVASSRRGPFWSVFERSHIPMALIARDGSYVAINDAAEDLFQYRREDVIGERAGRTSLDVDPASRVAEWEELERSGEVYSERVLQDSSGRPIRVSYAAHATEIDGQWRALVVALSAQVDPGGAELIKASRPPSAESDSGPGRARSGLTRREQEIVRQVSLGRSTPQIARDLNLSPATVRSHVRNAMVKTGAHTRAQLVALVLGDGLAAG